jgi:hypothetical protein
VLRLLQQVSPSLAMFNARTGSIKGDDNVMRYRPRVEGPGAPIACLDGMNIQFGINGLGEELSGQDVVVRQSLASETGSDQPD